MNFKNVSGEFKINSLSVLMLLTIINSLLLLSSLSIPFFGDDFAWLLQSGSASSISFLEYISSPAPFDYFRPFPKLFFCFVSEILNGSFFLFRIIIIILQIVCSFLVYKFTLSLKYSEKAALTAALIFSVLSCHSEALFYINCVNEIFSALFILTGLYLFSKNDSKTSVLPVVSAFILALFSRESAVCYIPLVFLVNIKTGKRNWKNVIIISVIPVSVYLVFRIFSETYFSGSNIGSMVDSLDLNLIKVAYKFLHYFVNMIFPVKLLFEFTGYDSLENLILIFRKPAENLLMFSLLFLTVFAVCASIISLLFKNLKKEIIFPVLFTVFALGIYVLSFNTAERFLYLPSVGICILFGKFYDNLKKTKTAVAALIIFLSVHSVALYMREIRYKEAAAYSSEVMEDLNSKTFSIENGSNVYFENLPPKKSGVFFISPYNFQSNWDYNFPERKLKFLFKETTSNDKADEVFKFNDNTSEFELVK